jgi:hypothetical protein
VADRPIVAGSDGHHNHAMTTRWVRLLVVDHVRPQDSRPEGLRFVFDGGVLDDADLAGTVFPDAEILSAGFHTLAHARSKVNPLLADPPGRRYALASTQGP